MDGIFIVLWIASSGYCITSLLRRSNIGTLAKAFFSVVAMIPFLGPWWYFVNFHSPASIPEGERCKPTSEIRRYVIMGLDKPRPPLWYRATLALTDSSAQQAKTKQKNEPVQSCPVPVEPSILDGFFVIEQELTDAVSLPERVQF